MHNDDHHLGLSGDLATIMNRRKALSLLAGVGLAALAGCDMTATATDDPSGSASAAGATGAAGKCEEIPQETAGPYPGDGSNGPNVLTQSGIVRGDIRSSFGDSNGTAAGVPTIVRLTIQDSENGCVPLAGAAVYLWQCDRDGRYSMYSAGVENQNYLRGVQQADENGLVTFQTIFPGCYAGRWPHMHFEVYRTLSAATSAGEMLRTSQLALPQDICAQVYATEGYDQSVANLARITLPTDNVFGDGFDDQLAAVGGTVAGGLTVTLNVPV